MSLLYYLNLKSPDAVKFIEGKFNIKIEDTDSIVYAALTHARDTTLYAVIEIDKTNLKKFFGNIKYKLQREDIEKNYLYIHSPFYWWNFKKKDIFYIYRSGKGMTTFFIVNNHKDDNKINIYMETDGYNQFNTKLGRNEIKGNYENYLKMFDAKEIIDSIKMLSL